MKRLVSEDTRSTTLKQIISQKLRCPGSKAHTVINIWHRHLAAAPAPNSANNQHLAAAPRRCTLQGHRAQTPKHTHWAVAPCSGASARAPLPISGVRTPHVQFLSWRGAYRVTVPPTLVYIPTPLLQTSLCRNQLLASLHPKNWSPYVPHRPPMQGNWMSLVFQHT